MAGKAWYYSRPDGPPAGPVSGNDLRRLAADGRLGRDALLSRRPGGRQVRADSLPGLFPADPGDYPDPPRRSRPADRDDPPTAGPLDLGFTRFVTPTLVKVLWAVWLFAALPLLTLAVLAQPVLVAVGGLGASPVPGAGGGPSAKAVIFAALLAVGQLIGLALNTLVVRVVLESVVVLFRGAEAVTAINDRQGGY